MIKNIIFDLGGVLLNHKTTIISDIISEMYPDAPSHQHAMKVWEGRVRLLNSGKITSMDFIRHLKEKVPTNLSEEKLYGIWREEYIKGAQNLNLEVITLIKNLKGRYNLYLLTDTIDVHDEYNLTRGLYDLFDRSFRSFLEGHSKHTIDAFKNILEKTGAQADETIFIDDLQPNIDLGKRIGIHGILFSSYPSLKKDLISLGITI